MQAPNFLSLMLRPAATGAVWALFAGFSSFATAANIPAAPSMNGFRPEFAQVARVHCPSGSALPRPLLEAAACGDVFRVRARLAESADVAVTESRPGLVGRTALHHAAQRGELENVRALLEAGADPNAQDAQGNTPLHLLALGERAKDEVEIARALIQAGADARLRNAKDATPLGALIVAGWYRIDPLHRSPVPLGSVLDEAEAKGPVRVAAAAGTVVAVETDTAPESGIPMAAREAAEVAVRSALEQWAAAWAARDVDAYLAFYGQDFRPSDGKSRQEWEAQRRARIGAAAVIEVKVSDVKLRFEGDQGVADFTQEYRSDSYRSTDRKRIVMTRNDGAWRIVEEGTSR